MTSYVSFRDEGGQPRYGMGTPPNLEPEIWEEDWSLDPRTYKLYTHLPPIELASEIAPSRLPALEAALDAPDHYAFHVNVIRLGREICKAPRPRCDVCPLRERCHFARQSPINSHVGLRTRTPRSRR